MLTASSLSRDTKFGRADHLGFARHEYDERIADKPRHDFIQICKEVTLEEWRAEALLLHVEPMALQLEVLPLHVEPMVLQPKHLSESAEPLLPQKRANF